ncbi:transporter substrate-binding domain-containing protein [uncultured Methanoregula sp.]|uniref:transporter substrate-binding domain-containing protein n=1 Tax=uncultured Methanoregula sp. TaxID=1005933 RepID=UPI002AAB6A01|nr:transporter substrate-binding domain-containing protein [uncultured Methanoregula sp.]
MMSRRLFVAGILVLFLICCIAVAFFILPQPKAPQVATPDDKMAEILARGTLVIATDSDYPPNSELKAGAVRSAGTKCTRNEYTADQFTGYNVAVAKEISRRLGVEPCFVTPTRTEIISGSWSDRWDIHIGSLAITPERMKVMYFTQPYYAGPVTLFVNKNNTAYANPGDLSGKKVGVCAGCILERYLEGTLDLPGQKIDFAIKNATIVAYENEAVALEDLALGDGVKLDAVLTNQPLGEDAMKGGMPIRQLGKPVFYDYDGAAVDRKSSRDPASFVRNVTGIIREMNQDGTLLKFSQQYYGRDLVTETARFNTSAIGQTPV